MNFKDYYQVLGVDRDVDEQTLKKAYRKLARKYHPDVSKEADAAARMSEVNEAYTVLSDPEKRAAYDAVGRGHHAGEEFRPPPDWGAGFEFSDRGDFDAGEFSDFFASLFGRARHGGGAADFRGFEAGAQRGRDHHARIAIDLADSYSGATRSIGLHSAVLDEHGRPSTRERTIEVQIPKGVREGQLIRLTGQGGPGHGGAPPGDLYLEVHFTPDPRWRIVDRDVYQTLPVAPWEAALGAAIEVPTPSGRVEVKVPAGSQSGRKLRLRGRGLPTATPGDLYLEIEIALPPADTDKARQLYETMARELRFDPRAGMR